MFGFGKKSKESNEARFSREFDDLVRQVKSVDREKQGLVGRGIQEAEKSFLKKYTTESFRLALFDEQMKQVDFIRSMETSLNKADGPIRILSIGYALFNRWQTAIMSSDPALIRQVEDQLRYFKDIADSYS
jgi:hypothetical protein